MSGSAIIELNDAGIRIAVDGREVQSSPACAVANGGDVLLGAAAAAVALLHPRDVNDRFWQRLNQQPLRRGSHPWRHHADIAYQHLAHVLELAGKPDSAILVVPGSFDNDQLALLLGIAAACGLEVQALVDTAVAAAAAAPETGRLTYVDLELHRTTVSQLEKREQVARSTTAVVEQAGLKRLHAAYVAYIADCFLNQSRFDPLHLAATEQVLYQQLQHWLAVLVGQPELHIHMDYNRSRFEAVIERRGLIDSARPIVSALAERVEGAVLLSHRFGNLPGIDELMPGARVVDPAAVFETFRAAAGWLQPDPDGRVPLTLALDARAGAGSAAGEPAAVVLPRPGPTATHLLVGTVAVPLDTRPLFVDRSGMPRSGSGDDALAVLTRDSAGMTVTPQAAAAIAVNGRTIDTATPLNPGDRVSSSRWPADLIAIQVRADAP